MHYSRQSYKSLADFDYHRVIDQKRNLAQVEKVLTMYENNNQSLVDQVHELIRENEMLRKQQTRSPKLAKSKLQPYKPQYSVSEHNENSQINTIVHNTTTTHKKPTILSTSKLRLNHPRDIYLPPQQAHIMNMKRLRQARTAHKNYDNSRGFEQFKEKLSAKKEELKKEYKKKRENSDLSLSRNVYIDRPQVETQEFSERKPLVEVQKVQPVTFNPIPTYVYSKRDNSPYNNQFKRQTPQPSPSKATGRSYKQPPKSAQRSSSAIKIQQIYPENSIKIAEPKTRWGDLSSTYFERSKWLQQDQNALMASSKLYYDKMGQSKGAKTKRKKFLNVVSLSVLEEKLQQKA